MATPTQIVVEKFLSRLQDQYGKNTYWRNNVKNLWYDAFERVPATKLQQLFDRYFQRKMGPFLPPLSELVEYVKADVGERYFLVDRGIFCHHCRDDPKGSSGGFRRLEMRYWDPKAKDGQGDHVVFNGVARCDCEAAKGSGGTYRDVARKIMAIDSHAVIRVSSQDDVMAMDTEQMWEHRIKRGYVRLAEDEHGEYYEPIWSHRFWRSSMGLSVVVQLGWEMPKEMQKIYLSAKKKRMTSLGLNTDHLNQSQAMSALINLIHNQNLEQV